MNDHPPRLAVGLQSSDSGVGCAMNVINFEQGNTYQGSFPPNIAWNLAWMVVRANDSCCTHRDGILLCAECSIKVLDLAHRVVDTALTWSALTITQQASVIAVWNAALPCGGRDWVPEDYYTAAEAAVTLFEAFTRTPCMADELIPALD